MTAARRPDRLLPQGREAAMTEYALGAAASCLDGSRLNLTKKQVEDLPPVDPAG
jgi:hypothetical protein